MNSELTEVEVYDPDVRIYNPADKKTHNKFTLYHTDLKYKKHRKVDIDRIVKYNPHLKFLKDECRDSLEYRLKESKSDNDETIDLSHMDINELPNDLSENIKYIFLSNNDFVFIDDLAKFTNLRVLDICNNKLTELPNLPNSIEEISCRNNYIENIDNLADLSNLKRLDISYNNLTEIPTIPNLNILMCYYNKIDKVNSMPNLKRLGAMYNKLKHIESFESLVELECDHNEIRKINGLPKLATLYINDNKLEDLGHLPNIRVLEIKRNIISKIPFYHTLECLIGDHKGIKQLSSKYVISDIDVFKDDIVTILFKNT